MTEQEAKDALFKLHFEYMTHTPKERAELYQEYIEKRAKIHKALAEAKIKKLENQPKKK